VLLERRLYGRALNSSPTSVNEPYFVQTAGGGGFNIFIDDRDNVGWGESVEVEFGLNGNDHWLFVSHDTPR
jgi:hypothetical protein